MGGPVGKITIQTTDGPREVAATVRRSGLAIHTTKPMTHTITGRQTVVYVTAAAVTHVASGWFICRVFNVKFAERVCRRLERSGVDWTRDQQALEADRDASAAVFAARGWHADQMVRLAVLGVDLRQGHVEASKEGV